MRNAGGSEDNFARAGGSLDSGDLKARRARDDLPTLLHLGMCMLGCAMARPGPEVVHLEQLPAGVGGRPDEHDALAGQWVQ